MNDLDFTISQLRAEAAGLPYGSTKVALLEEAVRLADSANDLKQAYDLRMELMGAATFSGRSDVCLVAFAWCCAQFDRDPEAYDESALLWRYKWICGSIVDFPEVSLEQIDHMRQDLERRFTEYGSNLHYVYQLRRSNYLWTGRPAMAQEAHASYLETPRGRLSDCAACVPSNNVMYYLEFEQWAEAAEAADRMLRQGLRCAEEPHRVFARSLLPLFRLGRLEEAKANQLKGYRLIRTHESLVGAAAEHLVFLVLTGEMERARRLLERHASPCLTCVRQLARLEFLSAGWLYALRRMRDGSKTVKLRLPESVDIPQSSKGRDVPTLVSWFGGEARALADRFDARNGNDFFRQRLEKIPALLDLAIST